MTTLETAVQQTVTAVTAANLTRGDGVALIVTDCDPLPGQLDKPAAVTVVFAGMDAVTWLIRVNLYIDTNADIPAAEKLARSLTPAIDTSLDGLDVPRSAWSKTFSQDFAAYIVTTTLQFGRDDF